MRTLIQETQYGIRMLGKQPGFTLAALLCLALGAGANLTIFTLVNAVLLRPVSGIAEPDRLVSLGRSEEGQGFDASSYPNYLDYRDRNRSFSGLLAFHTTKVSLSTREVTERLQGAIVSGNYFSALGVEMAQGRAFGPEEDQTPGTHPVAVVSHRLWQRQFGADPGLVGKTMTLNGQPFTIIGVASAGFKGTEIGQALDVWIPTMMQRQVLPDFDLLGTRNSSWLQIAGRLKPDVTVQQAQTEMDVIAGQLRQSYPSDYRMTQGIKVAPGIGIDPDDRAEATEYLALVMAVTGLVLLIACANVANLLLARAETRRREIAIRLALGASRARIIRQFLTESLLLGSAGTAAGLLAPLWTKDWLLSMFAQALDPASLEFRPDFRVVGFALAVSLGTGLISGIAPAVQASKSDLVPELKDSVTPRGSRFRSGNLVVVAQLALSMALLVGAGLLVRTLQKAYAVDPGFDAEKVLAVSLDLKPQAYSESRGQQFYRELEERISALPGAESAAVAAMLPLGWGSRDSAVFIEGHGPRPDGRPLAVDNNIVSAGYFQTMRMGLMSGRDFTTQDDDKASDVVIVNEAMAQRFWPGENAVGKSFGVAGRPTMRTVEIIGVVRNTRHRTLQEEPRPVMYLPLLQHYQPQMVLHVRTAVEPMSLLAGVSNIVSQLDSSLPVFDVKTLSQRVDESLWPERTMSTLVSIFAFIALLLAAIGLYGVMSYMVARRNHEIGIRMALGAASGDVMKLIVGQGVKLATAGLMIGLLASFGLTRLMSSLLFGVSATDPLTHVVIAFILAAVVLAACWIPARRAVSVDPIAALRCE